METHIRDLFDLHAVASRRKHAHLLAVVGDRPYSIDAKEGMAVFGDLRFHAQILGTESTVSRTWLWSWVEGKSTTPKAMSKAAEKLTALAIDKGIVELQRAEQPLAVATGEVIASIASGLFAVGPYFRGAYEGGAVYGVITDPQFPAMPVDDAAAVSAAFAEASAALELRSQSNAFLGYVKWLKWQLAHEGDAIIATDPAGTAVAAHFDHSGRMTSIGLAQAHAAGGG